jgi:hypothetical protein
MEKNDVLLLSMGQRQKLIDDTHNKKYETQIKEVISAYFSEVCRSKINETIKRPMRLGKELEMEREACCLLLSLPYVSQKNRLIIAYLVLTKECAVMLP